MRSWPEAWPAAVREVYESLARQFNWPDDVVHGVTANIEYLRGLDESGRARVYFCGEAEDARWLFEAVEYGAEFVAIRQVVIGHDGSVHRYSWRRREDDGGGLTDQAIELAEGLERCGAAEFIEAWGTGE